MYKTAAAQISDEIWDSYSETSDLGLRNKILLAYLHIVTVNAKKINGSLKVKSDLQEIINQGVLALIDCIDNFDPQRGVQFESFASIRVRGSIIDYMRKQDWVPRDLRKKSINILNACSQLQNELGREATEQEVAQRLNIGIDELNRVKAQTNSFCPLSYEELVSDNITLNRGEESDQLAPEQALMRREFKDYVMEAVERLGKEEKYIVILYYFEGLKLKDIAKRLNLTGARVSQIHSRALMKLKSMLCRYIN